MPNTIIIGLGNPGNAYQQTRHNIGFMALDLLARDLNLTWQVKPRWQAEVASNQNTILVKPQTYMNKSGEAVASIINFYHWSPDRLKTSLIVIHDDLDIALGQYKKALGRGPKSHNGISSIETSLATDGFIRYRVGIDHRQGNRIIPGDEYVLSDFPPAEVPLMTDCLSSLVTEIKKTIEDYAQNR